MSFKLELDPKQVWRVETGLPADSVIVCDEGGCRIVPRVPKQEEPEEIRKGVYRVKLTDQWIPLPEAFVKQLGWQEGDEIDVIPSMNGQVILRKKDALKAV